MFGLPDPDGHWFYLKDLVDNSVFMLCFFAFWAAWLV